MALPESPQSRAEQYYAYLAGLAITYPTAPQSRIEEYLEYMCQHGISGGGGTGDANMDEVIDIINQLIKVGATPEEFTKLLISGEPEQIEVLTIDDLANSAAEARLINTVQITEDVNNVLVTVDSNGDPLSITGNLLIEMVTAISTKNVAMHINVNSDKLAYTEDKIIGTNVACIGTTQGYNVLTMLRFGDKSVSFWANSKGSGASGTSTTQTYTGYRSVGVINSIRFGASNTSDLIPAGSEFKIYEVK